MILYPLAYEMELSTGSVWRQYAYAPVYRESITLSPPPCYLSVAVGLSISSRRGAPERPSSRCIALQHKDTARYNHTNRRFDELDSYSTTIRPFRGPGRPLLGVRPRAAHSVIMRRQAKPPDAAIEPQNPHRGRRVPVPPHRRSGARKCLDPAARRRLSSPSPPPTSIQSPDRQVSPPSPLNILGPTPSFLP